MANHFAIARPGDLGTGPEGRRQGRKAEREARQQAVAASEAVVLEAPCLDGHRGVNDGEAGVENKVVHVLVPLLDR